MLQDEVLDEIRQVREEHLKSFNYDLNAMFADWQRRQTEDGRQVVSLLPKNYVASRWSQPSKSSNLGETTSNKPRFSDT
jgi:hypothetical protein